MFFRVLCPLSDCVWKFSPDKSKGLAQISCCVVQLQTPAAAMATAALPACPVAGGACFLSVRGLCYFPVQ